MAIQVRLYTFSKRENSTKLPDTQAHPYNCELKEECSILNPEIKLSIGNPSEYNYAYIPAFNRYYWIVDWTQDHNFWIASCTVDVLATYATEIKNSSQYVIRCSTMSDSNIVDMMYPMTDVVDFGKYVFPQRPVGRDLRYMIAMSNANASSSVGGCTYYNLSYGQFANVMGKLLGSSSYLGDFSLDGISDSLVKALVNPLQYIGETYILPYDIGKTPSGSHPEALLNAGWWPVDPDYGYPVLNNTMILQRHELWRQNNVTLPLHPQTAQAGAYINCAPYTSYTLYAGPFGILQLDATVLHNCTRLDFVVNGDFKGNIELEIYGWSMKDGTLTEFLVDKRNANCAIPISLTQANNDLKAGAKMGVAAAGAVGSAVSVNPAGLCANIVDGLGSAADFFIPKAEGQANVGSFDDILEDWILMAEFRNVTESAPNIHGKPLCKAVILNTISGYPYIKCHTPHIEIGGTQEEQQKILSYLSGGMYIDL